jgi:hypothetical protein
MSIEGHATTDFPSPQQVGGMTELGHLVWAYAYIRALYNHDIDLFYGMILKDPTKLMPIA